MKIAARIRSTIRQMKLPSEKRIYYNGSENPARGCAEKRRNGETGKRRLRPFTDSPIRPFHLFKSGVERWAFGVCFICSFSPMLPSRPRARTHQEAALPCVGVRPLHGRDRNFEHCNRQRPFSRATTRLKTAAVIRSSDLRSTRWHQARDHERTRHPGERRSRWHRHPTGAPDRRSPFPKAELVIARKSCRENKSLAL